MRYWFYILFFIAIGLNAQSPFQNALLASKAQAGPVAIYQGNNPSDPNNEVADVSMMVPANANQSFSSTAIRSTAGSLSTRFQSLTSGAGDAQVPLTGVESGKRYALSVDVYSESVTGANYLWLDPTRGWSGADVDGVTYELIPTAPGWYTINLQATAGTNNASLWLSMGNEIIIDFDTIILTEIPI